MYGALGSRSSVIFDLDGDGDLDIVTNDFNTEPLVLISDLSKRTTVRQIRVRLVGVDSNRDGLGARVTVHAGARRMSRSTTVKAGTCPRVACRFTSDWVRPRRSTRSR
ncbi:MAG: hypothetical protein CM1200mP2_03060 [Planctomycetaceae bacterium]|nr:MAG: hypothetical protein CM1200mP2_03060 [Planctomycetaceae bacterium]